MKKCLVFIISFFWIGCFSQAINVDTNTYTVPQLVTDVLVNKACVPVSNITWRTGNTNGFGSSNGIGYFTNTNPAFPLPSGVILSTGNVANAAGPNTSQLNDGNTSWTGDSDLEATLLASGITMNSTNATVLEFDFVPFSANFDFNFLFASEEYGNFQCQFSDAFAFLLTNTVTGVTTNLAVIPNTTTPISVVTIRNSLYNSSCSSQNPTYFGAFNGGSNAAGSATNFNGQTVSMSASSTSLVPNTAYHIKLVIADRQDNQADSAIFLGANSFNVGQDVLGPDLTVASNTAICANETHTLVSGLNPAVYSFAWTFNGNPIGGNTPNLAVIQAGVYGLTYSIIATNCPVTTDLITIEYHNPITTPDPVDLFQCNSGQANSTFDLSFNTPIVSVPGTQISYHASLADAALNNNPLPNNYTLATASLPATIWTRIMDTGTNCLITKTFQLRLTPPPVANNAGDLTLCETFAGTNTANFNLGQQTAAVLGAQSAAIYDVTYYGNLADADAGTNPIDSTVPYTSGNATLFARIQTTTDPTCFNTTNFNLTVVLRPIVDQLPNQYVCNSYTLPPLVNPGNYYSGPNKGLPMLNAGDVITADQIVYIYSETATTPSCPFESSFSIIIIKPGDLSPTDIDACDQHQLTPLFFGLRYFTMPGGPSGGGTEIRGGTILTTPGTTTVYTYFSSTDIANPCVLEGLLKINIHITPTINPIANVFDCTSYNLPPLSVGDYYTYDAVTGIYTPAVSPITTTTTLHIFAINNGCRTPDTVFTVYINTLGLADINECLPYTLPPAPVGEYRDAPNGGGNLIPPGVISLTTTVYTYVPGAGTPNCTDDDFFRITINGPFLTTPTDVITCDSFLLPAQVDGGEYYTLAGGPATPNNIKLIPNVDKITTTTTLYIYKPSPTIVGCYNEKPWLITINEKPEIDSRANIEQCASYVLTPLSNGNYYDDPNGVKPLTAGTVISANNRIYIYAAHPNDPFCYSENFFDISINGVQSDPIPTQLSYCGSFTFPPLPTANNFYYDAPGGPLGGGNIIPAGTTVTPATVLPTYYIYYETGDRLNCSDEKPFSITIAPRPVANTVNPLASCDTFGVNDGIFQFDLTTLSIRNQVLNGQTPDANFTLTFYTSLAGANDINAIPIANPATYQNDNPFADSVWIRVANNTIPNPCFDVVELKLIVNPMPNPQLDSEYFICEDYQTGTLLNPATLNTGISGANYLFEWTLDGNPFGGNTPSITTSQIGNYAVKVTNTTTTCVNTSVTKVSKYTPYLEIAYSDAFENQTFITVNVLGVGSGNYEYKLDDFPYQDSNQFTNANPGEHIISVRDKDGHCDPPPISAVIINYPKFFTPNGDGFNETWNIPHLLSTNPNAPIFIFDRYGKLLKEITPTTAGWNGMYNGQQLPSTDYWFTVDYDEKGISKIFKSHFTLKR
ncbi:gliding motility-associated C-terminal domain-containing protein [Flavobacterium fluvii]|uniref:Gliding motility-associated C-terminal domain-containing protein n=1 Tax=Flavobacterium fluvii TaxID=468056 RepID=A0A1M5H803_9FLAO|nr:choice-of-anchor L domain-containing protein [Flavobacterium fluvii]SHG11822.1 gliding motility-associated C-terminal domain-containing protein [Flavobacterium fluvii]